MNNCPTAEQLSLLLRGQLSDHENSTLAEHIETCHDCSQSLELMKASESISAHATQLASRATLLPQNVERKQVAKTMMGDKVAPSKQAVVAIEGYEIIKELGRGGMGVVYLARQVSLERLVALKVMSPGVTVNETERFRSEALAVGMLKHPGFVQIHEIGEWQPSGDQSPLPYFCLEYVEGGCLDKHLKQQSMPAREAAQLVEQLARAMQVAHTAGMVHRDLKPANILLTKGGHPKIADFGIVKRLDVEAKQTIPGFVMGTPSYMAPEQASGKKIGPGVDIYGLGAILYELLTGRPPFLGATPLDTMLQVVEQPPVPPRQLQPKVPRDLETVCLKCLAKEPGKRYASAEALADDLHRVLAGKPTVARPPGSVERVVMWARRHPINAVLTTLLASVILISLVSLTFFSWRSEQLREKAERDRQIALQAKAEAEQAKNEMEQSQEGTYTLNQFLLEQVLTAPLQIPNSKGKNMTLLDVIEHAAPKLPTTFAKFPIIEGSLQDAFGKTCTVFGDYEKAIKHLTRAVEVRTQALGAKHEHTIESQIDLAAVLINRNQLNEAEPLLRSAYAVQQELFGLEDSRTLRALTRYAHLQYRRGQFKEADQLFQSLLEIKQRTLGANHPDTLEIRMGLAGVLQSEAKFEEAIVQFQEAAQSSLQLYGERHPSTIVAYRQLGDALLNGKHPDQAVPILEKTVQSYRDYISKKHPSLFSAQASLSEARQQLGKLTEAEAGFREALEGFRATMPANDWLIPVTQCRLGSCLAEEKKYEEAEREMLAAMALLEKASFVPVSRQRDCYDRMVKFYTKWGKTTQATSWKERLGKVQ